MIALCLMGLQDGYQITKTLTIAELSKHQSQQLIPASEMLDVFVNTIFADEVVEVIPVKESYQLREHILVLIHMQTILAAKVQNQVR